MAAATEQKAGDAKTPGDKPQGDQKDQAYWQTRMTTAREELRRNEMFAEALQTRINALNRDFNSRDNPAQRSAIGADRTEAVKELTRVKQDVERGKKQIVDLEEEARKAARLGALTPAGRSSPLKEADNNKSRASKFLGITYKMLL